VKDYAPVMQGRFSADGEVKSARLYMVGLGLYTAMLNGCSITKEVLAPGVWDYEEEVQYQTYDVTDLLATENTLEVTLGNGWYKGRFGLEQARPFGNDFALLAQLHVTYIDGREQVFCTDEGWRWYESDIRADNGIYDGETLDRLAHTAYENPLRPVMIADIPLRVTDRVTPPTVEAELLPVAEVITTPAGETVLDFGQNHAGWLRFRATLPRGAQVHFDFGEVLQQGIFYNDNYRSAVGGFTYRSDGREEVVCQQFTFYGFRYVRVTGWVGEVKAEDFESPVLHTDMERTGWLHSGNEALNRLYENTLWGQKSNFLSIPTDCPQRDERLGWTGDAQVFAPTACYNMDCRAFYRSFLRFLRLEQQRHRGAVPTYVPSMGDFNACAIWSDAAALIPQTLLRFSGVTEEAAQHYDLMKEWVDYVTKCNDGPLYTAGFQLGDWLAQDGITSQSFKGGTDDVFLASAYRMASARIVADIACRMGKDEDAQRYEALEEEIRSAIMETYFTPAGRLSVDTQAAYVTALHFGLWRDKNVLREQFRRRMRFDGFAIRCGFAGAPLMCSVLAEHGMEDFACDLLLRRGFPGWLYAVELGATTVWERWNSLLEDGTCSGTGMNSLNHYAYGSVMAYVYGHLAGLRPGEQGFRHAVIAPKPDIRLGNLTCTCRTASGEYSGSWRICEDGQLAVHIEVPFGCTAQVMLPYNEKNSFVLAAGSYDYCYVPARNLRYPYHWDSRLSTLAEDEAAQAVLGQELPQLLGILKSDNREFTTQTFRELSHAFFLGLNEENVGKLVARLETLPYKR
ncbi:MAG: family 78 glycoside hydrolase catalytic domain, partial [Oscillospiraceae bacterium]|nr:family 78 glycoside hydrolase catalytic domain [Oscillospiraceae bacterium]